MLKHKTFDVHMEFRNGLAGTMPMEPHLIEAHIDKYVEGVSNALKAGKAKEGVVSEEAIAAYKRHATTVFRMDEHGPYVAGHMITAMMHKASTVMGQWGAKGGMLQKTIQDGGVLIPNAIYIDGTFTLTERPVAPEMRGRPQGTIALFETIHDGSADFEMRVMQNGALGEELLRDIWLQCQETGLGGFRHLGYGKHDTTLTLKD